MREVLRDKKTLVFMVLVPTLLVPILMNFMIKFVMKAEKQAREETLTYAVFGEEFLPELAGEFTEEKGFKKAFIDSQEDIAEAIEDNKIKFALIIPGTARQQFESGQQVTVQFYYNSVSVASQVRNRTKRVINEFSNKHRSEQLTGLGLDTIEKQNHLLNPVIIEEHDTANLRAVLGERVGGMLPYLFIIFCFLGALYPAIDLGAGEKERGTLETLLLAPIKRHEIVLGKFLVIFTTGVTAALLCLTSMGVMLATKVEQVPGDLREVIASISVVDLALIAAMLIPTAAMFAALLLSISIYAKSYKEASAYCGPLNILVIAPAFIAMLPFVKLDWRWAMVPITNISLATKELIKGTMDYYMLIAILGSSIVIASVFLLFCTKWFKRESVLFRE